MDQGHLYNLLSSTKENAMSAKEISLMIGEKSTSIKQKLNKLKKSGFAKSIVVEIDTKLKEERYYKKC